MDTYLVDDGILIPSGAPVHRLPARCQCPAETLPLSSAFSFLAEEGTSGLVGVLFAGYVLRANRNVPKNFPSQMGIERFNITDESLTCRPLLRIYNPLLSPK